MAYRAPYDAAAYQTGYHAPYDNPTEGGYDAAHNGVYEMPQIGQAQYDQGQYDQGQYAQGQYAPGQYAPAHHAHSQYDPGLLSPNMSPSPRLSPNSRYRGTVHEKPSAITLTTGVSRRQEPSNQLRYDSTMRLPSVPNHPQGKTKVC